MCKYFTRSKRSKLKHHTRLIIGAGPAGLMAAWWMARCGIAARIVDKRGVKVINGHADGLRPRTEELFDSMGSGLMEKVNEEGYIFENLKTWVGTELVSWCLASNWH